MARKRRSGPEVYADRIARLMARGLSRSAARGHPKAGEPRAGKAPAPAGPDRRLLRERDLALSQGFRRVKAGESLTATAKALHISRERLRRYIGEHAAFRRVGRRFRIVEDRRKLRLPLYTAGDVRTVTVDAANASELGRFMAAVGRFLETNEIAHLRPFVGGRIVDIHDRRHPFETNPEALYALDARGEASFQTYNSVQYDGD